MNERNLAALRALLWKIATKEALIGREEIDAIAAGLAARGVLVPSALTDEQVDKAAGIEGLFEGLGDKEAADCRQWSRDYLERIAKGES